MNDNDFQPKMLQKIFARLYQTMLHPPLSLYLPIEKHASSLRTLRDFGNLWKITKILGPFWPTWHNGNLPYRTKFRRTKLSNFGGQCRKFCPSKFCPIRYYLTLLSVRFFRYKSEHICRSYSSVVLKNSVSPYVIAFY